MYNKTNNNKTKKLMAFIPLISYREISNPQDLQKICLKMTAALETLEI